MNFVIYDIGLLIAFAIIVSIFLYKNKSKIKREGLMVLYRTQWGTQLIEKTGKKYKKTLKFLGYVSISVGTILIITMLYFFAKITSVYIYEQQIVKAIKIPPIMPLIPYVDKLVPGIPPVYFVYFVFILAFIAIPHEFFHGIFMKRYNIKIKSTGFGFFPFFFPVLPVAFVEQEEKSFEKSSRFEQMACLAAGTFANVIVAVLFFILMFGFFTTAFTPTGVQFDSYAYNLVNIENITSINGIDTDINSYEQLLASINSEEFNYITANGFNFIATKALIEKQNQTESFIMYYDAPAINANLSGVIKKINGVTIDSKETLSQEIKKYSPGDKITIEMDNSEKIYEQEIILGENPESPGIAWLGIGFYDRSSTGLIGKIFSAITFKESNVYYESKIDGWSIFIYNLLWWIAVASISVALVNMLPIGGLDGGRFLYLGIWSLTGSEKLGKRAYKFMTYLLLFGVAVMMFFWARSWF